MKDSKILKVTNKEMIDIKVSLEYLAKNESTNWYLISIFYCSGFVRCWGGCAGIARRVEKSTYATFGASVGFLGVVEISRV